MSASHSQMTKEEIEKWRKWMVNHPEAHSQRVIDFGILCDLALKALSDGPSSRDAVLEEAARAVENEKSLWRTSAPTYVVPDDVAGAWAALDNAAADIRALKNAAPQGVGSAARASGQDSLRATQPAESASEAGAERWIPVSERLPDTDGDYLVCVKPVLEKRGFVYSATYEKPDHKFINPWSFSGVTHWRELPAPPSATADGVK